MAVPKSVYVETAASDLGINLGGASEDAKLRVYKQAIGAIRDVLY